MDLFGVDNSLLRVTKHMVFYRWHTYLITGKTDPWSAPVFSAVLFDGWIVHRISTAWPAWSRSGVTPVLGTSNTYCDGPLHSQNLLGRRPTELASCSQRCACSYVWSSLQMVCEKRFASFTRWWLGHWVEKNQMSIRNVQDHNPSELRHLDDIPLYWLLFCWSL